MPKRVSPSTLLRKARKEIYKLSVDNSRLSEAYTRECGLLEYTRKKTQDLQDELDRAKEMLGPMSGLVRPEVLDMRFMEATARFDYDVADQGQVGPYGSDIKESYNILRVPLDVLLTNINRDRLTDVIHTYVQFKGETVGYAISPGAYKRVSRDRFEKDIVEFMVKDMARQLIKQLRK